MGRHEKVDHNFHVTANLVMNLAAHAREIFESSEADEKRQLLDLVFQNLQLKGGSLSVSVREPFLTMLDFKNRPEEWGRPDSNWRRPKSGDLQSPAIAAMRHPRKWEKRREFSKISRLPSRICWRKELNPQPSDYKSGALPIELRQQRTKKGYQIFPIPLKLRDFRPARQRPLSFGAFRALSAALRQENPRAEPFFWESQRC